MILQFLVNGLVTGCLYSLVALGFSLIYNTSRVFHIAHGATYTLAAYVLYLSWIVFAHGALWGLGLGVILGLGISALAAAVMERVVYGPLARRGAPPLLAFIGSIGLYGILVNLVAMFFGNEVKVLRPGIARTFAVGGVILSDIQVLELLAGCVLSLAVLIALRRTFWGRLVRAVRDNPTLVEVLGYDIWRIRTGVFVGGTVLGGIAAMLQAVDVGINPHGGMSMFLNAAVAMIVGGVSVFEGALLGSVLLGLLQSIAVWKFPSHIVDAVTFGVLILFLVLRPEGILGVRRRLEEDAS